jgi:hypothetical protein
LPHACQRNKWSNEIGKMEWTPERKSIGHTHGSASSEAKA